MLPDLYLQQKFLYWYLWIKLWYPEVMIIPIRFLINNEVQHVYSAVNYHVLSSSSLFYVKCGTRLVILLHITYFLHCIEQVINLCLQLWWWSLHLACTYEQCNLLEHHNTNCHLNRTLGCMEIYVFNVNEVYCFFWLLIWLSLESAMGIDCYQCLSSKSVDCTDSMIHDGNFSATTCDHVFEARYCIKTIGLYGGT